MQLRDKKGIIWEPNFLRGMILPKDEWTLIKAPLKDFKRAFIFSDIIADFCLKNKINYFNGSPRFKEYPGVFPVPLCHFLHGQSE